MPKTDPDRLDPRLKWQLRSTLDRVQPPYSSPRYQQQPDSVRRSGIATGLFAAGVAGLLVLTLLAAASARSMDLQHRIVNTIQSATEATPVQTPEQSPTPPPQVAVQAPPKASSPAPHAAQSPEPTDPPEPGDSRSTPWPSPSPGDDHGLYGSPSPTPGDH